MAAGKRISQEEGNYSLIPSSTIWLKLCGHRRTTVPGDINEQNVMADEAVAV